MTDPVASLNAALAGRYRIERHLGEGGMASVYLAQDVRHDRKVALKLLKPELAAVLGAERFVQEIKTTAALQHPHILPLFDSGTADGFLFYVMPYVEGETLRDKLNRETQLAVGDAVRIAQEVADALDYAHRHGVIHRDIKPENILLHDGRPMVADFGIALAVSAAAGGRMTETGISLGTPHYMSPEQATADKDIGARSDIYSLASVLYEMLAGQPPHLGGSAQQVIMKIITAPVEPVTTYRKSVPPNVAAALTKALEKLPADRFDSAKAFAAALGNADFTLPSSDGVRSFTAHGVRSHAFTGAATASGVLLVVALWGWFRPPPAAPVIRYELQVPSGVAGDLGAPAPVPAPDGSFIVLHGPAQDSRFGQMLWMKPRDSRSAKPIPATEGARAFALSPDGQWIAFAVGHQLRKLQIAGSAPVTLVNEGVNSGFGVTWLDDGTIVFVRDVGARVSLAQLPAAGGEASDVWRSDTLFHVLPSAIAGTHAILFERCKSSVACDLWAIDLRDDHARLVMAGATSARYAATGDIVYVQQGRLFASRFDRDALAVRGQPVPLADSIAATPFPIELSRSGLLVTRVGGSATAGNEFDMVWVDRAGHITPVDTAWRFRVTAFANDQGWALSPDGRRLAIGLLTDAGDDIWVKELPRGPLSRVSYDPAPDVRPRWTGDGRSVIFFSERAVSGVYQHRADGAGKDSLLLGGIIDEAAPSPDGRWLVFRDGSNGAMRGGRDIKGVRLGADTTRVPVIVTPFDEEAIALSPDAKWIAYQSDETGRTEVFIRSFPNTDTFKRQVSNGGGSAPLWSHDGRELYYLSAGKDMMSARLTTSPAISVSQPVALFHVPDELLAVEYDYYTPWDVAADGRFIMARLRRRDGAESTVVIAENWLTELRARMKR
ncbi:MAG TPA: protein kinase [Gemmatimonadaceae bacterium]|nr:protein kinase [Gemmatimonadaceae bacterium]